MQVEWAAPQEHHALEDEGHADSRDERREPGRVA